MSEDLSIETKGLSLKKVFTKGDYFVIPSYQRDYVWSKDDIETLLDSIYDGYKKGMDKYIGTLIFHNKSNLKDTSYEWYDIVDGQQRLLSFLFLFISFAKIGRVKYSQAAKYICVDESDAERELLGGKKYCKLQSYDACVSNYLNSILSDFSSKDFQHREKSKWGSIEDRSIFESETLKNIKLILDFMTTKLSSLIDIDDLGCTFFDYCLNKIKFVFVSTNSLEIALDLFNSINTTGVKLTPVDIFKSRLLDINQYGLYKDEDSGFYSFSIPDTDSTLCKDVIEWGKMCNRINDVTNVGCLMADKQTSSFEQFISTCILILSAKWFKIYKCTSPNEFLIRLENSDYSKRDVIDELYKLYDVYMKYIVKIGGHSLLYKRSMLNLRGSKYTYFTIYSLAPILYYLYAFDTTDDEKDLFIYKYDVLNYLMVLSGQHKENSFVAILTKLVSKHSTMALNEAMGSIISELSKNSNCGRVHDVLKEALHSVFELDTDLASKSSMVKYYLVSLMRYVTYNNSNLCSDIEIDEFLANLFSSKSVVDITSLSSDYYVDGLKNIGCFVLSSNTTGDVKKKGKDSEIIDLILSGGERYGLLFLPNQFNSNDYIRIGSSVNVLSERTNFILDFLVNYMLEAYPELGY